MQILFWKKSQCESKLTKWKWNCLVAAFWMSWATAGAENLITYGLKTPEPTFLQYISHEKCVTEHSSDPMP